jgi:hypothetical protein
MACLATNATDSKELLAGTSRRKTLREGVPPGILGGGALTTRFEKAKEGGGAAWREMSPASTALAFKQSSPGGRGQVQPASTTCGVHGSGDLTCDRRSWLWDEGPHGSSWGEVP